MLQYICLVLDNYEKEQKNRNAPSTKDFLYPPVLPIVFYDGPDQWTARRNFRDRTALADVFGKYIPAFEYELVELNKYRQEDLIEFCDALSFIMLIDKLGTKEGLQILKKLPQDYIEQIQLKVPENLSRLMTDVITALLYRLEAPGEEIAAVTDLIERKEYRTMFDALVESVLEDKRQAVLQEREKARQEWEKVVRQEREKVRQEQERAWQEREMARQEKLEGARRLKQMGVSPDIIAAGFGFSLDKIERL